MKLSVNWLRELVDTVPDDVEALSERMTLLGLEVEAMERFELAFPGVVIGHVLEAKPHPDADRLRVCRVQVGGDELDIVCGAPNVRAGLHVPVATVGAVLPGDFKIRKSKIRGQISMGMICSEKELGLGQGHEGILELEGSPEVGRPFDELFGVRDTVIEIEVTPNRPDWLSHLGVARELVAHYGGGLRLPEVSDEVPVVEHDEQWRVHIEDAEGCRRFRARLVDGVQVGPSPVWMRQRLLALGQRPINAVVDASNYVLHEVGHPNHCFDRDRIGGQTVRIRRAREGETFTTLDDVERTLEPHHLLVADEERGLALAGIMGGADSEVGEQTRNLLLEVAVFDPRTIRRGRRDHGLSTDASYRFERGVDHAAVPWVSRRLCDLFVAVAGGTAHEKVVEAIGEVPEAPRPFFVRAPQVERLLGTPVPPDRMMEILRGLDIPCEQGEREGVKGVEVRSPSFRHDLEAEIDVIEELGRHHGFDVLPERARVPMVAPALRGRGEELRRRLREAFAARGFHEVLGSSFMRASDPDAMGLADDDPQRRTVSVLNPVVQGEETLKTSAVPEMARIVDRNRRRGHTGPIRLFQIAKNFLAVDGEPLPREPEQLMLAWSGPVRPLHADDTSREVDLFDALGELESVLAQMGIDVRRESTTDRPWLRAGSELTLWAGERILGSVGELAPVARRALDVEDAVLLAELEMEGLVAASAGTTRFRSFSSYPPSRRDLSLVVPVRVRWAELEAAVADHFGGLLEHCELFDVYTGDDLPAGTEALGIRLSLRSDEGTLKDKKVDALIRGLLQRLEADHDVKLRSASEATE